MVRITIVLQLHFQMPTSRRICFDAEILEPHTSCKKRESFRVQPQSPGSATRGDGSNKRQVHSFLSGYRQRLI